MGGRRLCILAGRRLAFSHREELPLELRLHLAVVHVENVLAAVPSGVRHGVAHRSVDIGGALAYYTNKQ
jgi:hypothetical protein